MTGFLPRGRLFLAPREGRFIRPLHDIVEYNQRQNDLTSRKRKRNRANTKRAAPECTEAAEFRVRCRAMNATMVQRGATGKFHEGVDIFSVARFGEQISSALVGGVDGDGQKHIPWFALGCLHTAQCAFKVFRVQFNADGAPARLQRRL